MESPGSRRVLAEVASEVTGCRVCPRLVEWREEVGRTKRAAYRDEEYWARGVPGFGDPDARLLVVGLAPAAPRGPPHRPDVHRRPLRGLACTGPCTAPATPTRPSRPVSATVWSSPERGSLRR